jgi:pSer/pThr/pTyr-binding forkhead associated (FHA) protein
MAIDRVFPSQKNPLLTLQFYNTTLRRWSDLGAVRGSYLDLGRSTFQDWNPNPEDLAESHVRLMIDEGKLYVEPLPSLNGVYIKLKPNRPAALAPGARFRIGRHVLAFRPGEAAAQAEPLRSAEGEVFQSRVLVPLGFLDLIGPDGRAYLSHPVTKAEEPGTRIGRAGARCDLALTGDDWVSSEHARVTFADGACFLEDLKSTNGTFLQLLGMQEIQCGAAARPDAGDIFAIGGYMIRVVEERP